MPKVLPSQVLSLIERHFEKQDTAVTHGTVGIYSAIVRLIDEIPTELLVLSAAEYDNLVCGVEAIRQVVTFWEQKGVAVVGAPAVGHTRALTLIRAALSVCPDQIPSPSTADLTFIDDQALRNSIRLDISTATSTFHNGEWKASTVLAGAAAEALLLWAITNCQKLSALETKPKAPPENWHLDDYIKVAAALGLITEDTAQQTTLAKNFRNLVHPGRAQRLGEVCDRATALTALAALEHIVRNLS